MNSRLDLSAYFIARHFEVVGRLHAHPEFGACAKVAGQPEGCVRCDCALAIDDSLMRICGTSMVLASGFLGSDDQLIDNNCPLPISVTLDDRAHESRMAKVTTIATTRAMSTAATERFRMAVPLIRGATLVSRATPRVQNRFKKMTPSLTSRRSGSVARRIRGDPCGEGRCGATKRRQAPEGNY
jgi:hypothetical protein